VRDLGGGVNCGCYCKVDGVILVGAARYNCCGVILRSWELTPKKPFKN